MGFLYGRYNEDTTVKVEFIYEPPQETTDISFTILPDEKEVSMAAHHAVIYVALVLTIECGCFLFSELCNSTCAQQLVGGLAGMLGLQKVGWIFSHPSREKG